MTTPPVALTVSVDSTGPAPTFPDGTLPATGAGTFSRGTRPRVRWRWRSVRSRWAWRVDVPWCAEASLTPSTTRAVSPLQ
jgi:hypothetical protein